MDMAQQLVLYHPAAENRWNGPRDLCNFCYRWL